MHPSKLPSLRIFSFVITAIVIGLFLALPALAAEKLVPPKGVAIPEADRAELEKGAAELGKLVESLRTRGGTTAALLPDVQIFHKAVDWALRYDEFLDVKQVAVARTLLAEGMTRAKSLGEGKSPWTEATGLVVRGYRSKIDGSIQPYGLVVPTTFHPEKGKSWRLDVWNHGRGETSTELAFVSEHMKKAGEFTPPDTFVLHPYGRFCNAMKFAGEQDVLEALAHARAAYPIDPNRILVRGFSMGGAATWQFAVHYPGLWAVAAPGAGFAETQEFSRVFQPGATPPPWWEMVTWRLYDATVSARNLRNYPVAAYSGEDDKQKQAADIMLKFAAEEGFDFPHFIGPKTGHKYEPETKLKVAAWVDEAAAKGRVQIPEKLSFVTYTLRYPNCYWLRADALNKHWERAQLEAEIVDKTKVRVTTKGVTAFTVRFPNPAYSTAGLKIAAFEIDGKPVAGAGLSAALEASFVKGSDGWKSVTAPVVRGKRTRLQGPIDDAFMEPFLFVRPTGKPLHPATGAWVQSEMERAIQQWRTVYRGNVQIVDDTALDPARMPDVNLILWGDPQSNKVMGKLAAQLPVQWSSATVAIPGVTAKLDAANHVPLLIAPNPAKPGRAVVLNSGFTFRGGSAISNALQIPKLPDWAIIDVRVPLAKEWGDAVVDAGFFDEDWRPARW